MAPAIGITQDAFGALLAVGFGVALAVLVAFGLGLVLGLALTVGLADGLCVGLTGVVGAAGSRADRSARSAASARACASWATGLGVGRSSRLATATPTEAEPDQGDRDRLTR